MILPTKDRGPEIELTFAALLAQDHADYEVVVVDNASRDDNAAALRSWCEQHPDVARYVHAAIPGLNRARNAGIENSRGALLVFLDDDALPEPGWLSAYDAAFAAHPGAWAAGGRIESHWTSPPPDWIDAEHEVFLSAFDRGDRITSLHYDDYPRGANMAFRREAFASCGPFHPSLDRTGDLLLSYGDIEMCYRVEQAGHEVLYVPDARVAHMIRGNRLNHDWFRVRSYWQGRSLARFERLHHGRLHLLRKLPYRVVRSFAGGNRSRRHMHRGMVAGSLRQLFASR